MEIEDLDEYQGLDLPKLRAYLAAKGWTSFTMPYANSTPKTFWRYPYVASPRQTALYTFGSDPLSDFRISFKMVGLQEHYSGRVT